MYRLQSLYDLLESHQSKHARPLNEERPEVPAVLAAVLARMMAKDPAQRYQTPAEVETALAPFVNRAGSAPIAIPLMPERKKPNVVPEPVGKSKLGDAPNLGHGLSI